MAGLSTLRSLNNSKFAGSKRIRQALFLMMAVAPAASLLPGRAMAAVDTWVGTTDANWSSPGNWTGGNAPPVSGDALIFDGSTNTTTNDDLAAQTQINGI